MDAPKSGLACALDVGQEVVDENGFVGVQACVFEQPRVGRGVRFALADQVRIIRAVEVGFEAGLVGLLDDSLHFAEVDRIDIAEQVEAIAFGLELLEQLQSFGGEIEQHSRPSILDVGGGDIFIFVQA